MVIWCRAVNTMTAAGLKHKNKQQNVEYLYNDAHSLRLGREGKYLQDGEPYHVTAGCPQLHAGQVALDQGQLDLLRPRHEGHLEQQKRKFTTNFSLNVSTMIGARCSSVVRAFAHGAMGRRIDPSWWTHWAISRFSQCSTTGVTKAMVCVILSVGWCIQKNPCYLIDKSSPCGSSGFLTIKCYLIRQDNTTPKFYIKFSFSSIGQEKSKLLKQICKLLILTRNK